MNRNAKVFYKSKNEAQWKQSEQFVIGDVVCVQETCECKTLTNLGWVGFDRNIRLEQTKLHKNAIEFYSDITSHFACTRMEILPSDEGIADFFEKRNNGKICLDWNSIVLTFCSNNYTLVCVKYHDLCLKESGDVGFNFFDEYLDLFSRQCATVIVAKNPLIDDRSLPYLHATITMEHPDNKEETYFSAGTYEVWFESGAESKVKKIHKDILHNIGNAVVYQELREEFDLATDFCVSKGVFALQKEPKTITNFRNKFRHDALFNVCLVFAPIFTNYVILWIVDFLPYIEPISRLKKVRLIEAVQKSIMKLDKTRTENNKLVRWA